MPEEIVLRVSVTNSLLKDLAHTGKRLFRCSYALKSNALTLAVEVNDRADRKHLTEERLTALKSAVVDKVVKLAVNADKLLILLHPSDLLKDLLCGHTLVNELLRSDSLEALAEAVCLGVDNVYLHFGMLCLKFLCNLAKRGVCTAKSRAYRKYERLLAALIKSDLVVALDLLNRGEAGLRKIVLRILNSLHSSIKAGDIKVVTLCEMLSLEVNVMPEDHNSQILIPLRCFFNTARRGAHNFSLHIFLFLFQSLGILLLNFKPFCKLKITFLRIFRSKTIANSFFNIAYSK